MILNYIWHLYNYLWNYNNNKLKIYISTMGTTFHTVFKNASGDIAKADVDHISQTR